MQTKPVELLRAVLAAIGPANSAVPAVRAAYDFLESLDEPAPVDVPPGLVEAVANDCAVDLLREAAPFAFKGDLVEITPEQLEAIRASIEKP